LRQKFPPQQRIEFAKVVESLTALWNSCSSVANRIANYPIQTPLAQAWSPLDRQVLVQRTLCTLCRARPLLAFLGWLVCITCSLHTLSAVF